MTGIVPLGWGSELPATTVTNEELAGALGGDAAALEAATGIRVRRRAAPGAGPSDLAAAAARRALAAGGLTPEDVDLIVFATMTPDIAFPGSGCFLQDKLGCRTIGALDIRAQCNGFLSALATADAFVRAGRVGRVLVCCAEVHSSGLDYTPRAAAVTPRFGDGAGVVVLGPGEPTALRSCVLHNDPAGFERFWCEFPASRHYPARMTRPMFEAGRHYYTVDAPALAEQARRSLAAVTHEALAAAGVGPDAIALFLVHYVDPRVAREAAALAGLPAERTLATAEAAGHVAAAGLPIAITEALASGRLRPGDLVCCAAFGAGVAWGGAVVRV
ncbi:MAG TPA: ketoacyl-ACP synthase III [Candidatus Limnocylindria bacterium]|nr:ketoacyl-ACP synthase III [Candidatus Limnocylindria bacterium]